MHSKICKQKPWLVVCQKGQNVSFYSDLSFIKSLTNVVIYILIEISESALWWILDFPANPVSLKVSAAQALYLLCSQFSTMTKLAGCTVSVTEWIFYHYWKSFICEHLDSAHLFVACSGIIILSFENTFC